MGEEVPSASAGGVLPAEARSTDKQAADKNADPAVTGRRTPLPSSPTKGHDPGHGDKLPDDCDDPRVSGEAGDKTAERAKDSERGLGQHRRRQRRSRPTY